MSDERKPEEKQIEEGVVRDLPVEKGADDVKGGWSPSALKTPSPGGPIPIPYPNLPK